ncbi:MAG: hypothetical protein K2G97_00610, partial [Oscillospiraceae bacterium]|nr:hypothetical protein [Oscillospiraceae bacterium]
SEINNGIKLNDNIKFLPNKYVKLANDIIYTEDFSLEELNYIKDKILEGKSIWADSGELNYEQMSSDYKNKLTSLAAKTSNHLGMTLTISDKDIKIVTKSGRIYKTESFETEYGSDKDVIKNTGIDINIFPLTAIFSLFFLLAFIGLFLFLKMRKREC